MAALQADAQAQAEAEVGTTAEGSLLQLLGQSGSVTGAAVSQTDSSADADAVARQLSTGDVQGAGTAAGAVARDRAPPPSSPR